MRKLKDQGPVAPQPESRADLEFWEKFKAKSGGGF